MPQRQRRRRRPLAPEFCCSVSCPRQSCQGKHYAYCGQTTPDLASQSANQPATGQSVPEKDFCVNLQIFQKLAAQFKSNAISVKQSAAAFHLAPTRHLAGWLDGSLAGCGAPS